MSAARLTRKFFALLAWALTGATIAVVLAAMAPQLVGWKSFTILTGSMAPTIDTGDVVVDDQVQATALRPGDIVTFREPDSKRLITHRVRSVSHSGAKLNITTKGDANDTVEHWSIPATGKVGRVNYRLPHLGYALQWIRAPYGKLLLIVVPAALLGLWELARIWRPQKEKPSDAVEA